MHARSALLVCFSLLLISSASRAEEPDPVLASLRVPEGFTVERVAAAPLVQHPVMAGFDDRGRLYVADNAGLNLPAQELLERLPNMVRMLEDTDGDGRFDKSTVFADKMTFPQGAAWFRGALYVASPPSIWRLEDTDGDGVADMREELVQKFGFIGNAADIHGCFITPTGRIAWCDGRHGHEFKGGEGQPPSKGLAARVFSCRPDGSDVEVFCGGGMDNPVEVAFMPEGDTIGTMTFYNPDDARHDALVHFVYGGVYPRKHPCTAEFKRTGDFLPALSRFGVTAPSGLARHASREWGDEFRDNLFSAQFNTHKVLRHILSRQAATYRATDAEFLSSDHVDFHPTDVLEDADGSLLVIDTGGWFRIGCPTSQVAKPEIGGAIYRIKRKGVGAIADPRGLKIDWARTSDTEMADLLADSRPAVVERAIEALVARGDAAMGTLATGLFEATDYRVRQHAIWALARIGTESARLLLRQALADDDAPARQSAAHAISDLRDGESVYRLIEMLGADEPAVQREVATALARLRNKIAVPALLRALAHPGDQFVEHSVIYALIEIDDAQSTLAGLSSEASNVRRGAIIALDQMDSQPLTREIVGPLWATSDPTLLSALVGILAKHPDWSDEITGKLAGWLSQSEPSADLLATTRGMIAALMAKPEIRKVVHQALANSQTAKPTQLMLLEEIARDELDKAKLVDWAEPLALSLASPDDDIARQAVITSGALNINSLAPRLTQLGLSTQRSRAVRIAALLAAAKGGAAVSQHGFDFLREQLASGADLRERLAAAEALGRFKLDEDRRQILARLIANCGVLELPWLLRAIEGSADSATGVLVVESLKKSPAVDSVSGDLLRGVLKSFPPDVQLAAKPLLDRSPADEQERVQRLAALEPALVAGDAAKGEDVFASQRAACSACHRIGNRGEKIGPDLSKIGEVRSRRDLLEAILFPSASLARGYESVNVVTQSGSVHNGLVTRETANALFLRASDRSEIRVDREDVDQLAPSRTSIMPQGLDKTLSTAELADLVAYLSSLK